MQTDIADWIKRERIKRSWSQAELARRIRAEGSTVSRWECGLNMPVLEQFKALCAAFCVDANAVLGLPTTVNARARAAREAGAV
jgi:transcriptional regulator with XRE-family HTH domain